MKTLLFAVALATAPMMLSGCATTPQSHLQQGQYTAASWHALQGAADSLTALATNGTLKGAKAAEAKGLLDKAAGALTAADAAYRAGNGATAQQNIATATALISQILLIVSQAKGA